MRVYNRHLNRMLPDALTFRIGCPHRSHVTTTQPDCVVPATERQRRLADSPTSLPKRASDRRTVGSCGI
eukprot:6992280-Pyramimonas_sp.AAC.1